MASASVLNRNSGANGPKVHQHVVSHVGQDRGLEVCAAECVTIATERHSRAFVDGIPDVHLHFLDRPHVDEWTLRHSLLESVAHLELTARHLGKTCRELLVDSLLDQQAVGTNAGLAAVAILGGHGPLDGRIQVGVIEHDERRVAAQLE
jgi:ParB family chromosome partitioning protein